MRSLQVIEESDLSVYELCDEIKARRKLCGELVGQLYSSILSSEIELLYEKLQIKLKE